MTSSSSHRAESATGIEAWSSKGWLDLAVAWLDRQLETLGVERTGDVEQPHLRAWATALRAPTTQGPVWMKAAGPGTAFEVRLYPLLARVAPRRALVPLASDLDRGWLLLPEGGKTLGDRIDDVDLGEALATVLPQYAELQLALTPHVDEMLALGVADMRAAVMASRFDEALETVSALTGREASDDDRSTLRRIAGRRSTFVEWCARLEHAPAAASLDHNDLHPWNVFVAGSGASLEARFYDWGDSVVAHPFASLLVGLGFLKERLGATSVNDRRILRVRDAYLEAFTSLARHAELVEALGLACRVAKVARALTWARAVAAIGDSKPGDGARSREFARAPFEALRGLLDDSYLGGA